MASVLVEIGDPALPKLIEAMKKSKLKTRSTAAAIIDQIGLPEEQTDRAWYAIAKQDWDSEYLLCEAGVEPLLLSLLDDDVSTRKSAEETLVKFGEPIIETLVSVIIDPSKHLPDDLGIYQQLGYKPEFLKQQAHHIIRDIGSTKAIEPLVAVYNHKEDEDVTRNIIFTIEKIGGDEAAEGLLRLLERDKYNGSIILALGIVKSGIAVMPLVNLLNELWIQKKKDEKSIYYCIKSLGDIGDKRAVPCLISILTDQEGLLLGGDPPLAYWSASALTKIGDARAIGPIIQVIKGSYLNTYTSTSSVTEKSSLRGSFGQLLTKLVEKNGGDKFKDLKEMKEWADELVKQQSE